MQYLLGAIFTQGSNFTLSGVKYFQVSRLLFLGVNPDVKNYFIERVKILSLFGGQIYFNQMTIFFLAYTKTIFINFVQFK